MARFDVYRGAKGLGYLLDCQADLLSHLETRAVVPLMPVAGLPKVSQLNPSFDIDGEPHLIATQLIFAIPVDRVGNRITSLADEHTVILNALDMLLTGV